MKKKSISGLTGCRPLRRAGVIRATGALGAGLIMGIGAMAFPPAPHHLIVGTVRDQFGNPLLNSAAVITLTTATSNSLSATLTPLLRPGENYRFAVPMDSGLTAALYKPTALLPAAPFTLRVTMGGVSYLPIEMTGNWQKLGLPGEQSRMDLTLGQDTDGDGLPDAWERSLFAKLGLVWAPGALNPNALAPGTGLTYYQIYISGTYNYAPTNGFTLNITSMNGPSPHLTFTAVQGRSYTVVGGSDPGHLSPVNFTIPALTTNAAPMAYYEAGTTQKLEVEVPVVEGQAPALFFRLLVE